MRLSAVATTASSRERGVHPSTRCAFSLVALRILQQREELLHRGVEPGRQPYHPVRQLTGRHLLRGIAQTRLSTFAMSSIDMHSPGDRDEALSSRRRARHRAQVQVGDVAHVDDAEVELRAAGHAVHQPLHQVERRRVVGPERGPEDARRVDAVSSSAPPSAAMKSHAARSAIAFDFTYTLISPSRLVQLVSSNGALRSGWP